MGAFFTRVARVLYIYLNSGGIFIREAIRVHRKTYVLKKTLTYAAYDLHASYPWAPVNRLQLTGGDSKCGTVVWATRRCIVQLAKPADFCIQARKGNKKER